MLEAQGLLPHVDELVMEYLLFRGFTKSFQAFTSERRRDRARGFDADQILSQLLLAVQTYQVESVLETWKFLSARFFHHLDASYAATLQKLETSLLRLYVVNAVKTGHREKAAEFFKRFANRLHATVPPRDADAGDSWARWFALPFIERPEADPYFRVFFTREWLEAFVASFRNFLALVFRSLPLPKLLAVQLSRLHDPTLKMRLKVSQSECSRLRVLNVEAAAKIKALEDAGRQLHSILRMMVQQSFLEHFSDSPGGAPGDEPADESASGRGAPRRRVQYSSSHLGLSRDQMRELGELFGVCAKESAATDVLFAGELAGRPLGSELLLSEEEQPSDDASAADSESVGAMSPPFSPIPGTDPLSVLEPHAEQSDDDDDSDGDDARPSEFWEGNAAAPRTVWDGEHALKLSLVQELSHLSDWKSDTPAMGTRSRFSRDGTLLAISQIGNSHVDIWRQEGREFSPSSTLALEHELTHMAWIKAGHRQQAVLCSLSDHSIGIWQVQNGELLSTLPSESEARITQLVSATDGSRAVCVYENENDHGGDIPVQEVRILDVTDDELSSRTATTGVGEVSAVAMSDCGRFVALGTADGQFSFISSSSPALGEVWSPPVEDVGDARARSVAAVCFSPDATTMLSTHASSGEVVEWGIRGVVSRLSSNDPDSSLQDSHPSVACRYHLGSGSGDREDARGLVAIRFLGGGDFFTVSDANRLQLFKRGQAHPVEMESLDQASLADLDWHPALPLCCSGAHDGTVALRAIEALGGVKERKEIGS